MLPLHDSASTLLGVQYEYNSIPTKRFQYGSSGSVHMSDGSIVLPLLWHEIIIFLNVKNVLFIRVVLGLLSHLNLEYTHRHKILLDSRSLCGCNKNSNKYFPSWVKLSQDACLQNRGTISIRHFCVPLHPYFQVQNTRHHSYASVTVTKIITPLYIRCH